MITGRVRADGTSTAVPEGVVDLAALGDNLEITAELEARLKALNLTSKESEARFKLEVYFAGGPRRGTEFRGLLCAWTNGGYLNGGGDASVYFCPNVRESVAGRKYTCLSPIDAQFMTARRAVCTSCKQLIRDSDLVGQILNTLPIEKWASFMAMMFHRLECNADLRICVVRGSIRKAMERETEKDRGGEVYAAVDAQREWIAYPLRSIIKDTASGSSLEQRIRAFLEA